MPPSPPPSPPLTIAQVTAAVKLQEALAAGDVAARAPLASASPVVLSSESTPAVVVLTPAGAPVGAPAAATGLGGAAGLKALEVRSNMEGGVANTALSSAYYSYSPPPDGGATILPPPPLVYVKETITTVTTTYPAGTPVPVAATPAPTTTSRGIDFDF